ncbi:hypothetical protein [Streptomyces griseoaurantiacus]|uniref:hypothetical protein n=1 Tax=Streptomyces griseoaurantiacus TaxID=68213 RepID=UPI0037AB18AA
MTSVQGEARGGTYWRTVADPRVLWPREVADFHPWLIGVLDRLAPLVGVERLEYVGREMPVGERWVHTDRHGRDRLVGGVRPDITARDEAGRRVVIEAQYGPADHQHLGQLLTYGRATGAALAVWVVADLDPVFSRDHLDVLAEQNVLFAGRRRFALVAVTVESDPSATPPVGDVSLVPRFHPVDLVTGTWASPPG